MLHWEDGSNQSDEKIPWREWRFRGSITSSRWVPPPFFSLPFLFLRRITNSRANITVPLWKVRQKSRIRFSLCSLEGKNDVIKRNCKIETRDCLIQKLDDETIYTVLIRKELIPRRKLLFRFTKYEPLIQACQTSDRYATHVARVV